VTFAASADVSVVANRPDRSFGLSPNLVDDRAPAARSYLRFDLGGLRGRMLRATLRLYAKTGSPAGYAARVALTAQSAAGMVFASSDARAHRPQLIVEARA
jgi:hypothetical protein